MTVKPQKNSFIEMFLTRALSVHSLKIRVNYTQGESSYQHKQSAWDEQTTHKV